MAYVPNKNTTFPNKNNKYSYPSGNIAVLITSVEKGKFSYIAYEVGCICESVVFLSTSPFNPLTAKGKFD